MHSPKKKKLAIHTKLSMCSFPPEPLLSVSDGHFNKKRDREERIK
ncbi:unnamed protein product, partial [Staurois parvus]